MSLVQIKSKLSDSTISIDKVGKKKVVRNAFPLSHGGACTRKYGSRWVTGYEPLVEGEFSPELQKELDTERKKFENLLGVSLSSESDNQFWVDFKIPLYTSDGGSYTLNLTKPEDKIAYRAALQGGVVAPSKDSINIGKYLDTMFYFEEPGLEDSKRKRVTKLKNKVGAKLAAHEDMKEWLLGVSFKLKLAANLDMSVDHLYNQLDMLKDSYTKEVDLEAMLKIMETPPIDLESDFIVSMAINRSIVTFSLDAKQYMFDNQTWGSTQEEVHQKLAKAQFAETYNKIKNKIYSLYKVK